MKTKLFLLCAFIITLISCKKEDDPGDVNEEELITTLSYVLVADTTGGKPEHNALFVFRDIDGDGANPPVIIKDTLLKNRKYVGAVVLLNESASPVENVTTEILEEKEDHQFFYQKTGINASFNYIPLEVDGNGKPIGITTDVTTNGASSGNLTITLRHQPNKSGANVAAGDITNAGGETDIEVTFPVVIE